MVAEQAGTKYAVATVNGTAALHIALMLAGVQADDEVVVSSLTFIAPANAIRYVGAWPVFIDAEPRYWQIDPNRSRRFPRTRLPMGRSRITQPAKTGRRVKAILPVHILGHPADLDPILAVAAKYSSARDRGCHRRSGCALSRAKPGRFGQRRLLQLQREQDHHHRRRRHARDQQCRVGRARQIPHHAGER